jgi:uroporphyrinogen-III synthase
LSTDLTGLKVAVTGSRRATELAHLVRSHGGSPYVAPTVGIESNVALNAEVERFCNVLTGRQVTYAIFMTGPGVYALLSAARSLGRDREILDALSRVSVVARSAKPKDALSKHGIRVDLVPPEATSEGILTLLRQHDIKDEVVVVLSHGSDSSYLGNGLRESGAEVIEFSTYSYSLETGSSGARILDSMRFAAVLPHRAGVVELIEDIIDGKIDAITFTSPPSAKNLFSVAFENGRLEPLRAALNSGVIVVAVGPPTRASVEAGGVTVDVVPSVYKMGPMIKAMCEYVKNGGTKKGVGGRPSSPKRDEQVRGPGSSERC